MKRKSLIGAIICLLPALAQGQVESRTTEHRSFAGVRDILIDNIRGDIDVTAGEGDRVEVDIATTLRADNQDRLELAKKEITVVATQQGAFLRLVVDGPFRTGDGRSAGYEFQHDFRVRVPKTVALDLHTVKSRVTVDGTTGGFKVRSVSGPVELSHMGGSGEASTVSGAVTASFSRNPAGPVYLRSVHGKVEASFSPTLHATVAVKTVHGGFYTDFETRADVQANSPEQVDGKYIWKRNRTTQVQIGGGGPELRLETVSGDILIRKQEH